MSLALSTAAVIGTSGLVALYTFATADADLSLLLRGKHKRDAFVGKVVWVTGASQVREAVEQKVGTGVQASCLYKLLVLSVVSDTQASCHGGQQTVTLNLIDEIIPMPYYQHCPSLGEEAHQDGKAQTGLLAPLLCSTGLCKQTASASQAVRDAAQTNSVCH